MKKLLTATFVALLMVGCGDEKKGAFVYPNLKYKITSDSVTITGCDKKAGGELVLPDTINGKSVTNIGVRAFYKCRYLTKIIIPNGVRKIGVVAGEWSAFEECKELIAITVTNGNAVYSSKDGVLFNKQKTVLLLCPNGKSGTYVIPDEVEYISTGGFMDCSKLTSITLSDSVEDIGDGSFQGCNSLISITIGNNVTSIGEMAFSECTQLTTVTFHGDAPRAENYIFHNSTPTIYRKPETQGWGDTWGGRPVKLIGEKP